MTSDDVVPRILAAIEETERAAYGSGVVAWATYRHADGSMKYTSPVSGGGGIWVTAGEQTEPDSVQVIFDERAVLRRCAADRRVVVRYLRALATQDDLESLRSQYKPEDFEDAIRASLVEVRVLRVVLRDLADSYGVAPATEPADEQEAHYGQAQ